MTAIARDWNNGQSVVKEQQEEFNKKIENSDLNDQDIDKILAVVNKEMERLESLSEAIQKKMEEIDNKKCCSGKTARDIWIVTILSLASRGVAAGGAAHIIRNQNNQTAQWVGLGISCAADIIGLGLDIFSNKIFMDSTEAGIISRLSDEGFENRRYFRKMLLKLKDINRIEKERTAPHGEEKLDGKRVTNEISPVNIDNMIREALVDYRAANSSLDNERFYYYRMLSWLIRKLPPDDPVRRSLSLFESENDPKSILMPIGQPPSVNYLPTPSRNQNLDTKEWVLEEANTGDASFAAIDPKQKFHDLIFEIDKRFSLDLDLFYFEKKPKYQDHSEDLEGVKGRVGLRKRRHFNTPMPSPLLPEPSSASNSLDPSSPAPNSTQFKSDSSPSVDARELLALENTPPTANRSGEIGILQSAVELDVRTSPAFMGIASDAII